MKNKKHIWILIIISILIIIDQLIKLQISQHLYDSNISVINGVLDLTYIENTKAAFGFGFNSMIILIFVNILIIVILTNFIVSKKEELDNIVLASLSLVLAGGISNVVDRIFRGFVIDYIDVNPLIKFAVFNFADICVVIGVTIIVIRIITDIIKQRQE